MKHISTKQQIDLNQLKNEMLSELRRLQNTLGRHEYRLQPRSYQNKKEYIPRNYEEIFKILKSYGIFFDVNKKIVIVSKNNGDFIINLLNGTVRFSPIICLKCHDKINCKSSQRKLCIVGDSKGWANFKFSEMDMLIVSKIFAIIYDQLPNHILEQIKNKSHCVKLENCVVQELCGEQYRIQTENSLYVRAPPIQGPITPPQIPDLNLRFNFTSKQIKPSFISSDIVQLKNEMLRELKHLQELMKFSKKFVKSSKVF